MAMTLQSSVFPGFKKPRSVLPVSPDTGSPELERIKTRITEVISAKPQPMPTVSSTLEQLKKSEALRRDDRSTAVVGRPADLPISGKTVDTVLASKPHASVAVPSALSAFKGSLTATADRIRDDLQSKLTVELGSINTGAGATPAQAVLTIVPAPQSISDKVTATLGATDQIPFLGPILTGSSAQAVGFTPFRIPLYRRGGFGLLGKDDINLNLAEKQIAVGRYVATFTVGKFSALPFLAITSPIPFEVAGKKEEVEKATYDPVTGKLVIQINVKNNLIPILIAIAAAGVAIGVGAWGLSDSLDSLDKVVIDTSNSAVALAAVGGLGYLAWKFIKR
jgi:hypothetical protein